MTQIVFGSVLIESDWNLKTKFKDALNLVDCSINRIRLEFKANRAYFWHFKIFCINRIRLEFKGNFVSDDTGNHAVLIESDWNLKQVMAWIKHFRDGSINRIRLEFKG